MSSPEQQKVNEWLRTATRVVEAVYPSVDWSCDTEETREAFRGLEFCLDEYFCVPDSYMDLEGVREAWRAYYRSCIPF